MKTNFTLFALFLSVLSLAQYFQPSSNLAHLSANFRTNGRVILGDELISPENHKFQVYKNSLVPVSSVFGNSHGRLDINVADVNGAFSSTAVPGDIILKRLGLNQNLTFSLGSTIPVNSPYNASNNFKFRFASGASLNSMLIYSTGKITMGTEKYDDSDYRLFVKDGIKTEKVKVEVASANGWADYVFEEDYNLLSLEEVENYIKENGHLPNIPSAEKVVEDGGFELKEMNVKLLEKIEELTLYIIDQNKRIEALEAKIIED